MKRVVSFALALVLLAVPAFAQSAQSEKDAKQRMGTLKVWSGAALIGVGALSLLVSRQSAGVELGGGIREEASVTNKTAVYTGLAEAGVGTWLLVSGLKDRREAAAMPSTAVGVSFGKRGAAVAFVRTW